MENNSNIETNTPANDPETIDYAAEYARLKSENEKLRKANTNASADASKYKKELQARMTEQERSDAAAKEQREQMEAEIKTLKRNQFIAEQTAGWLGLGAGMDSDLAKEAAEATADGDFTALIETITKFVIARDKASKAESIRNMTAPAAGGVKPTVTPEQFAEMGYKDRVKLYNEQPEVYKELTK